MTLTTPCRSWLSPPYAALLAATAVALAPIGAHARPPSTLPPPTPIATPQAPSSGAAGATPSPVAPPSASTKTPAGAPQEPSGLTIEPLGPYRMEGNSLHLTGGISVTYLGFTLSADTLDGDPNRELIFSGHARIERDGLLSEADAIHFYPVDGRYRLDNPRGMISPSLLEGRVTEPVLFTSHDLFGEETGYSLAQRIIATTCRERYHHYELRIANAELFPHQRLVLRRVSVFLFGVKLITLPEIVIPLNETRRRRPRTDYLPEIGQNYDEGYYVRLPYAFSEGDNGGTLVRLDVTQKRGLGYRIEQEYLAGKQPSTYSTGGGNYGGSAGLGPGDSGAYINAFGYGSAGARLPRLGTESVPQNGGLFTMQGYFNEGFNQNFNLSYKHQQDIGGSNHFSFDTEVQNNSYFVLGAATTSSTSQTTRFDFAHNDATHGVQADLNINLARTGSTGFSTNQLTADFKQAFQFASGGTTRNSLSFEANLSHLLTTTTDLTSTTGATSESVNRSEQLDTQFQLQHVAREYSLTLNANDNAPIGFQSGGSSFGSVEKLPELLASVDTFNFKRGWLKDLPTTFQFGYGEYSEPSSDITTDRVLLGLTTRPITILRGRTELVTAAGIEQHFYGDGAADYIVHDATDLRQHLAGRSGIDVHYSYDQPEGGTPFVFDQLPRSHSLTAEAGYLDDRRFQLTARVGYNLLGSALVGQSPWQSLSTHLMYRPVSTARFDATQSYDPNTGRFIILNNQLQRRGKNDAGVDLVWSIDPNQPGIRRKFTAINTQFNTPLGRSWRITGLFQFNGGNGLIVGRNLEISHDWDCMEASLTYSETVGGYRPDRQFYLAIRIKAFPFFRAFNRGPAGGTLGTGIGSIY